VQKQALPFYSWMKVGFTLFEALGAKYPLYRQGQAEQHALEVFPHATAFALAGRHKPKEMSKVRWRRLVLAEQGFDISGLSNADCVDAALAALTAAHALRGTFSAFGDPAEGVIVTPYLR
jgi:predicted RNase H-like nuclease